MAQHHGQLQGVISARAKVSLEIQSQGDGDRSDRHRDLSDLLRWEAFLDAIGVMPLSFSDVSDDVSVAQLGRRDPKKRSEGRCNLDGLGLYQPDAYQTRFSFK